MTEQSTIAVYPLDGTNRKFVVPYEYLARRFVTVTLLGTDRKPLVLGTDFRFVSANQIETTRAWGDTQGYANIEVRRKTSATQRLVDFYDGSVLRSRDLNVSAIQTIHIAEEARNMAGETLAENLEGNLDARFRKMVNLGVGTDDFDAVTVGQMKTWSASALNQANRSESEADRSQGQATLATQRAAAALASQNATKVSETNSKTSETNAKTSETNAKASETNAKASETNAKASETNAKVSELAAEGFATEAEQSAQAAAQSAAQSDAVLLRQDLANPDNGAELVGYMGRTLAAELPEHGVSIGGWAKGDGTDESEQINEWLDYIHARSLTGIIPSGTFVGRNLRLQAGHHIVGAAGATLKLPPNSSKFSRLLTTEANRWRSTSPTSDSPIIYIRGVRFDGNRTNQGDYLGHQKEQQMLLMLDGGASTEFGQYRLRVIVDGCDFAESCSDGVSVYSSVDVSVINCKFDNCFRGSVVVIGGNSAVRAANIKAGGDIHNSFFQSEVEGTLPVDITLTNSTFETLRGQPLTGTGMDIGVKAGSNVTINNCVIRAGLSRIDGADRTSVINVSDSIIYNIGSTDQLVNHGQATFDNVEFIHANNATVSTISTRSFNRIGLRARFTNCRFRFANDPMAEVTPIGITSAVTASSGGLTVLKLSLEADHGLTFGNSSFDVVEVSGMSPSDYNGRYWVTSGPASNQINLQIQEIYGPIEVGSASIKICPMYRAIYNYSEPQNGLGNKLIVQGCEFDYPYLEAVTLMQGGRLVMHSNDIESFSIARLSSSLSRFVDASIGEQSRIGSGCRFMGYMTAEGGISQVTLNTEGLALPARASGVRPNAARLTGVTFKGQRLIYGDQVPMTAMRRMANDVYRRDVAPDGTPSLWQATNVTNGLASAWRQRQQTIGRGATAERPTLTASDVGCQYMDTTLAAGGQTIFWNGSAWVDTMGTVV